MKTRLAVIVLFALTALPLPAIAAGSSPDMNAIHQQFAAKDAEIAALKAQIAALKEQIFELRQQLVSKHARAIYDRSHPTAEPVYGPVSSFSLSYVPPAATRPQPVYQPQPVAQQPTYDETQNSAPPQYGFFPGAFVGTDRLCTNRRVKSPPAQ